MNEKMKKMKKIKIKCCIFAKMQIFCKLFEKTEKFD